MFPPILLIILLSSAGFQIVAASWLRRASSNHHGIDGSNELSGTMRFKDHSGIYSQALERLSHIQGASTCKHQATNRLLDTCETLQSSPGSERTLETIQNLYSAHLALCELQSAATSIPSACGLELPGKGEDAIKFLKAGGERRLSKCLKALQSSPQWWTSYSNNRQDAYVWCKAMRTAIDHDDMVETMRMVIKTTSEVEKASSDLSEQLTRATTHHRRFISEVDLLRRSILDDLQNSRTEATGMFQQLFAQTETGIQSILARIFATMEQAEQATESFDQKIEASSKNALELNGLIVHSKRIVLDGASEVSAAHRRQIEDSQALALQHLESMGESFALKLLALENATTKMDVLSQGIDDMQAKLESVVGQIQTVDSWLSRILGGMHSIRELFEEKILGFLSPLIGITLICFLWFSLKKPLFLVVVISMASYWSVVTIFIGLPDTSRILIIASILLTCTAVFAAVMRRASSDKTLQHLRQLDSLSKNHLLHDLFSQEQHHHLRIQPFTIPNTRRSPSLSPTLPAFSE